MNQTGWMKHKLESRLLGEISVTSDMQMTPPLAESKDLKSLLMKVKEFQKSIYFWLIVYAKAFDCVDHNKLWKILKRDGNTRSP